ncbi:MAG: hypothetical protein ACREGD_04280 [Candidatus Saccharimonadales bacterium]
MESVADLLGRFGRQEPSEVAALKRYIESEFKTRCSVAVQGEKLVIAVPSAALANTLRLRVTTLQQVAKTSKRLMIRIG